MLSWPTCLHCTSAASWMIICTHIDHFNEFLWPIPSHVASELFPHYFQSAQAAHQVCTGSITSLMSHSFELDSAPTLTMLGTLTNLLGPLKSSLLCLDLVPHVQSHDNPRPLAQNPEELNTSAQFTSDLIRILC
eukprot:Gb_22713 [translate_table: standard]